MGKGKHSAQRKSSSTRGIDKGEKCQKSPLKIRFAKDNRMYRTDPREYAKAEQLVIELNK